MVSASYLWVSHRTAPFLGGRDSSTWIFSCTGVSTSNSCAVQGHVYFKCWRCQRPKEDEWSGNLRQACPGPRESHSQRESESIHAAPGLQPRILKTTSWWSGPGSDRRPVSHKYWTQTPLTFLGTLSFIQETSHSTSNEPSPWQSFAPSSQLLCFCQHIYPPLAPNPKAVLTTNMHTCPNWASSVSQRKHYSEVRCLPHSKG